MKITPLKLERIKAIFVDLEKVNGEIATIEKYAAHVAEHDITVPINMQFPDFKESAKIKVDEMEGASPLEHVMAFAPAELRGLFQGGVIKMKSKSKDGLNLLMRDSETLMVLGVLIACRNKRQLDLMAKLKRYGMDVQPLIK